MAGRFNDVQKQKTPNNKYVHIYFKPLWVTINTVRSLGTSPYRLIDSPDTIYQIPNSRVKTCNTVCPGPRNAPLEMPMTRNAHLQAITVPPHTHRLPACLPRMPYSEVTLEGGYQVTAPQGGPQGDNLEENQGKKLTQIHSSGSSYLGVAIQWKLGFWHPKETCWQWHRQHTVLGQVCLRSYQTQCIWIVQIPFNRYWRKLF